MSDSRHAPKTCLCILVRFPYSHLIPFYSEQFESWHKANNLRPDGKSLGKPVSVCLVSIFSWVVPTTEYTRVSNIEHFPLWCTASLYWKREKLFFYFSIGVSYLTRGDFKCRLILGWGSYRKLNELVSLLLLDSRYHGDERLLPEYNPSMSDDVKVVAEAEDAYSESSQEVFPDYFSEESEASNSQRSMYLATLKLNKVRPEQKGIYKCGPSNTRSASVELHITDGM